MESVSEHSADDEDAEENDSVEFKTFSWLLNYNIILLQILY